MVIDPFISLLTVALSLAAGAVGLWYGQMASQRARLARATSDEHRFACIACEDASDGLVVVDMNGIIQWVNPSYCRIMGYAPDEMIGRNPMSFAVLPENRLDAAALAAFNMQAAVTEPGVLELHENIRKDGTVFWNQISISFHTSLSEDTFVVMVCRDVTANVEKEKQLKATSRKLAQIAAQDDLTGAANRAALSRFLEAALVRANNTGTRIGVLHIDLDQFKMINDSHGHSAGDAVLIAVTQRLKSVLRDADLVSRVGGDEFVVVCGDLHTLDDVMKIGQALSEAVNKPVNWQNHALNCQISVGAALSHPDMTSADQMLVQSDFALYDVKRNGRGRVATYDAELHRRQTRLAQRQTDLLDAISDKTLTFHFQPVIAKEPGIVRGFEALVRWEHPTDGMISPDEILPLAQSLGVMADLDFLAMNAALDMKVAMNSAGHGDVLVSFNTSPEGLGHPDFIDTLLSGLAFRDLTPDDVIVEVLETVVFEDHLAATEFVQVVADLDAAGIFTVLDDFGSGNAGIAQLAKLAIKGVKFDKSISKNILTDQTTEIVYKTLTSLCDELDLRMVTEGVESVQQAERLKALGCTNMQGFLISKPLPGDAVIGWLDDYTASAIAPDGGPRYLRAN